MDADYRLKQVTWCDQCQKFMCESCRKNKFRRILAFLKNVVVGDALDA